MNARGNAGAQRMPPGRRWRPRGLVFCLLVSCGCLQGDELDQDRDGFDIGEDCDDSEATVHPEAVETCNGRDDDCDGELDEGALDALVFYLDADDDGVGDGGSTLWGCEAPSGYVANSGDCDDDDPARSPWLDEICGDGLDNDCDSGSDASCGQPVTDLSLENADAQLDGTESSFFGVSLSRAGDVDGDGHGDVLIGASADGSAGEEAGAAYLFLGPLSGTRQAYQADARLLGAPGDKAGTVVAGGPDLDADGLADLLVSAPQSDLGGEDAGAVHLVSAAISGELPLAHASALLIGEEPGDLAGWGMTAAELSGDDQADLFVAARATYDHYDAESVLYLVHGPISGNASLSGADVILRSCLEGAAAGLSLSASGDMDGDGYNDALLGAPRASESYKQAGACLMVPGPLSDDSDLTQSATCLLGTQASANAGQSVSILGDVDGDGYAEAAVGAYVQDTVYELAGCVYVLAGGNEFFHLAGLEQASPLDNALAIIEGNQYCQYFGRSVSAAGDVDGDGLQDLLAGAATEDGEEQWSGAAYLYLGPISGHLSLDAASARLGGAVAESRSGQAVAGAGDLDANGFDELHIGGPYSEINTGEA